MSSFQTKPVSLFMSQCSKFDFSEDDLFISTQKQNPKYKHIVLKFFIQFIWLIQSDMW